ncbi:MAG: PQQ-dependent dehydrogenase, methanol/ethanol family [Alphaproteobacteria bacterium]|nr:MAG: PQQ-dependent dehydrogenase, methanol/ethanol family [Alphaproteobacteria bacterium]
MNKTLLAEKIFILLLLIAAFWGVFKSDPTSPEASTSPAASTEVLAETSQQAAEETDQVATQADETVAQATAGAAVDGTRIANADSEPGNWMAHGRTYSEQRYSPLDQINKETVAELGFLWDYDADAIRGMEATPLVVDGVMYSSGPWSKVFALDARTGEELWSYDPEVPGQKARDACCDVVNRGVAVWKGKVYVGALDGRLIALDAQTGTPVWSVQTFDPAQPYTITGAPRIVKDKVIIGNGGAEYGVRGYITAYDTETGEQAWRFYIVPGNPSLPAESPEMEIAMKTWDSSGSDVKYWDVGGGGTAWDSMAYDPDLNLLYVGTGNGAPWNRLIRSSGGGDNLFLSSIVAINPDTGRMSWYYQTTPGENWDYTATQHMILAEIEFNGEPRKVIMQAPKNGFFYVLDRETGELLSAEKYGRANWATQVDMETGRPVENPDLEYIQELKEIAPAPGGAHNWHPMAYSPQTGLVYIPAIDATFFYNHVEDYVHKNGAWNTGNDFAVLTDVFKSVGVETGADLNFTPSAGKLKAWDPVAGTLRWEIDRKTVINGGLLATAGGLIFQGTGDGYFIAVDAETGEEVKRIQTGTAIIAPPITYTIDGEQYISVLAGYGGGGHSSAYDPAISIHEFGNQGRVLTFKLGTGQDVPLPTYEAPEMIEPPAVTGSPEDVAKGSDIFQRNCAVCHGLFARGLGHAFIPDLRYSVGALGDNYHDIIIDGALQDNGMGSFSDILTDEDVELIREYIKFEANSLWRKQQQEEEGEALSQ